MNIIRDPYASCSAASSTRYEETTLVIQGEYQDALRELRRNMPLARRGVGMPKVRR
jgi:hypothetical protein